MKLQESGEDYLEAVLILHNKTGFVRSVDIAARLGVTKPSVSHAMSVLREAGYLTMDPRTNQILLTESGKAVAERIYERHCLLSKSLMAIGVSPETALADACKIEHDISEETFQRIKEHVGPAGPGGGKSQPQ